MALREGVVLGDVDAVFVDVAVLAMAQVVAELGITDDVADLDDVAKRRAE